LAESAPAPEAPAWEARFRAPRTYWVRIASGRPDRGIACTNASGVYQLHRWTLGEPIGDPITTEPTGRTIGWISPDGGWVIWHQDLAGNERGHFVAERWAGAVETRIAWCRRSIEFVERALGIDTALPV
jgi:hypothetical protein